MKTFHRPMFRRGGSAGEGITSGLRQGYNRGRVVNPGGYKGDDPYELLKGYLEFRKVLLELIDPGIV